MNCDAFISLNGVRRLAVFVLLLLTGCVQDSGGRVASGKAPTWYDDPGTFWGP